MTRNKKTGKKIKQKTECKTREKFFILRFQMKVDKNRRKYDDKTASLPGTSRE